MPEPNGSEKKKKEPNQYDELRQLVVGPERAKLEALHQRITDPAKRAEDVSQVLPEAIKLQSNPDSRLNQVLTPIVNEAIRTSVRRDARVLGDALFPVMGPAIRKAIAETIRHMVQSFNQAVENSFTLRGIRWRLEAWRSNRPFGEIVLLHSLVYRVEQVFLIHRTTGVQLQHVAAEAVAAQDPDMVSAMLTAIQDFVRDSFGSGRDETLETFRVGELTIWIEHTGDLVLAAVVRGTAPEDLREVLRSALIEIQSETTSDLGNFSGDTSPFELIRPRLEGCLRSHYVEEKGTRRNLYIWIALSLVAIGLGILLFFGIRDTTRVNRYIARLRAEPGYLLTDARRQGQSLYLNGLRDPLATDPGQLAVESGIRAGRVKGDWRPYSSHYPLFMAIRARKLLNAPASVKFAVTDTILEISGHARHVWLVQARDLMRFVDGISAVDTRRLHDIEFDSLAARVRAFLIRFPVGAAEPISGQSAVITRLASDLRQMIFLAHEVGAESRINLIGHTDNTGQEATNLSLSQYRAKLLETRLVANGVDKRMLTTTGAGISRPVAPETSDETRSRNRSVTIELEVNGLSLPD